jgi:hypothetical protein
MKHKLLIQLNLIKTNNYKNRGVTFHNADSAWRTLSNNLASKTTLTLAPRVSKSFVYSILEYLQCGSHTFLAQE